jgi:hypothetical protein
MYPQPVSGVVGTMPKVTSWPVSAAAMPASSAVRNPAAFWITWSAASTSSSGSSLWAVVCRAATATAAAVLRPMGSSRIALGSTPIWRICTAQ